MSIALIYHSRLDVVSASNILELLSMHCVTSEVYGVGQTVSAMSDVFTGDDESRTSVSWDVLSRCSNHCVFLPSNRGLNSWGLHSLDCRSWGQVRRVMHFSQHESSIQKFGGQVCDQKTNKHLL